MKIEELVAIATEDLMVEKDKLDDKSIHLPIIQGKWLGFFYHESMVLKTLKLTHKKTYKDKWLYYTGKADSQAYIDNPLPLKILKQDAAIFMESDDDLIALNMKSNLQQEKVAYVENILKSLNNMQWTIRNCIEFLKFTNGQ